MSESNIEGKSSVIPDNLAMVFQETITATIRLKSGRQQVSDAQAFRSQMREALRAAQEQARARGYSDTSVNLAIFGVVAFLDEAVLNIQNPAFAGWSGRPLQDELFGGHEAGETFFENVNRLLAKGDSSEMADILEVYQLCILLGYRGRYGGTAQGEVGSLLQAMRQKIQRIRGTSQDLAPNWALPKNERSPVMADPWLRPLIFAAAACLLFVVILLAGFSLSLNSGLREMRSLNGQAR